MRLATREEIYKIDQAAAEEYGLSTSRLIENAGHALTQSFEKIFHHEKWPKKWKIGIWCGAGNNGADGRVMAHLLREKDFSAEVLQGTSWRPQDFEIVVDALFGVGLNRPIEGLLREQILKLNKAQRKVIAVDIPSGLDANTGVVLGAAVKAQWTLTIAPAKPGLFLNEGPAQAGHIQSLDIGLPRELVVKNADKVFLVGKASARKLLPARTATSNKSHFGHLLVVAGSAGMEGAALLVAEAAARMGCGYVTLCSPSAEIAKKSRPDFLHLSLEFFFKSDLKKYTAVVVGPGLGVNEQSSKIFDYLVRHHGKVLVDADALTVLSQRSALKLPESWLLTPHAGELSRILGIPAKELEKDRLQSVQKAQKNKTCLVLFKGFRTVLCGPQKTYIIGSGNVALAKAGSGDVLSGFIGSLMAQNLATDKAAALGAYLHGWIADDWLRRGHSSRTLMASDLPELLDASLRSLKKRP
jgi:NAD(P)H-hydrate epimerase